MQTSHPSTRIPTDPQGGHGVGVDEGAGVAGRGVGYAASLRSEKAAAKNFESAWSDAHTAHLKNGFFEHCK